jgi:hypothetical protein
MSGPYSPGRRAALSLALLAILGVNSLVAETSANTGAAANAGTTANADALAVPEGIKHENPLFRFEIVSLGSYPLSLFYIGFIYDIKRYYDNGKDSAYAPWPFRGSSSVSLTNAERMDRLEAALFLSLSVGAVDALIHAIKVKKAQRLREAQMWAAAGGEGP